MDFVGRNEASSRNVGVAGVEVGYQVGKGAARRVVHVDDYKHDPANFPAQPKAAFRRIITTYPRAGLVAAAARGRKGGRKPVVTPDKLKRARTLIAQGLTVREVAARLKVGKTALYEALEGSDIKAPTAEATT